MNTFPSLGRSADFQGFVDEYSESAFKLASSESGYPCPNAIQTFDPRTWTYVISHVGETDKNTLMDFYQDNKGIPFYWTNDQDDTIYEVLFVRKPTCHIQDNTDDKETWQIELQLIQTSATELPAGIITRRFYGGDCMIEIENLAPGADITSRPAWVATDDITINSVMLLVKGTPSGIDDTNTVIITIRDKAGNILLTKTYNTSIQPPTNDSEDLTDLLDEDYAELDAGDYLTLTVTQGVTANMPAFAIAFGGYFR